MEIAVEVVANDNTKKVGEYFISKVEALSYTEQQIQPQAEMGCPFYGYYTQIFGNIDNSDRSPTSLLMTVAHKPQNVPYGAGYNLKKEDFLRPVRYLYAPIEKNIVNELLLSSVFGFVISDNLHNTYSFSLPQSDYTVRARTNGELFLDSVLKTSDYSYIRPFPKGLSGVYTPVVSLRDEVLLFEKNLIPVDGAHMMGVVVSTTNYSPGEVIYTIKKTIEIDKETLYKITGFTISPKRG